LIFLEPIKEMLNLSLYDALGQRVRGYTVGTGSRFTLDIRQVPGGIYFLRIESKNLDKSLKVLVVE